MEHNSMQSSDSNCMDFSLLTVAVIWTYLDKALNVMYNTNKNRKIF